MSEEEAIEQLRAAISDIEEHGKIPPPWYDPVRALLGNHESMRMALDGMVDITRDYLTDPTPEALAIFTSKYGSLMYWNEGTNR